jgi:NhaP-type Na+/H+ or K+/H+ antiporter
MKTTDERMRAVARQFWNVMSIFLVLTGLLILAAGIRSVMIHHLHWGIGAIIGAIGLLCLMVIGRRIVLGTDKGISERK